MRMFLLILLTSACVAAAPSRYAGVAFPAGEAGVAEAGDAPARAAATQGPGVVRTALSLAAVVGLVVLLGVAYRKAGGGGAGRPAGGVARVLGRSAVSPRHGVVLVQVGRRVLVCGETAGQPLSRLDVITDPDEIAQLAGQSRGGATGEPFVMSLAEATGAYDDDEDFPNPGDAEVPAKLAREDAGEGGDLKHLLSRVRGLAGGAKT